MGARSGHVLINDEGEVAGLDQTFCDMMLSGAQAMRGRRVIDVTAPVRKAYPRLCWKSFGRYR